MLPRQPPIRGQRKIFPFISRIFLCSPREKGARDGPRGAGRGWRSRCRADHCRRGGRRGASLNPSPVEDNVCRDTLKHVDIYLLADVCECIYVQRFLVRGPVSQTRKTARILDCTLHSTHTLGSSRFAVNDDATSTTVPKSSCEFSSPTDTVPALLSLLFHRFPDDCPPTRTVYSPKISPRSSILMQLIEKSSLRTFEIGLVFLFL